MNACAALLGGRWVPLLQISRVAKTYLRGGRHVGQQRVADDDAVGVGLGAGGAGQRVVAARIARLRRMPFAPRANKACAHERDNVCVGGQHGLELFSMPLDLCSCGVFAALGKVVAED